VEQPVRNILSEARAICDYNHDLSAEKFNSTVDDMLESTIRVSFLLDKFLKDV
jgi:hypothetical protein